MRPGSPTHAFDPEQRLVGLSFAVSGTTLTVSAPPNAQIAPPGYYMLFILNSKGVPSVAKFVQLSTTPADQAPKGTITQPASDVTIQAGQAVTFAGSGLDPDGAIATYSWIFPSGNPDETLVQNPGAVTFATPGRYVVSLTVVDNMGVNDPSPPTRTVTVGRPPTANPGGPYSGTAGKLIGFNGGGSSDPNPGGTITSYAWTFGDGATGSGATPTHAYATAGVYTVVLTVTDNIGLSGSASTTVTVKSPPAAPSGLMASLSSPTAVKLTWTDNSTSESGFKIERSTDGVHFSQIATVGAGVTTYTNSGLHHLTQYYYRVRAYNSVGNSAYSNTVVIQTQ